MESEDQDILAKISQLSGQINRHKNRSSVGNQQVDLASPYNSARKAFPTSARGSTRGISSRRPYHRGLRAGQVHRNRTLVLNGSTATPKEGSSGPATNENNVDSSQNDASGPGWVTKTDRHLQLINTTIFEKDSQTRAKAMEETRKLKLKQRDEREKMKINKHLLRNRSAAAADTSSPRHTQTHGNYIVDIQGIQFQVAKNGSKLLKMNADFNSAKSTPKTAAVGGVRFYRSKSGNMYRSGIIKAHRKTSTIKKIDEPCKAFSTTGSCSKGPRCRYTHNAAQVAVCKNFLLEGSCPSGESCDLSHNLTVERIPSCTHFARGNCSNPSCRYSHVRVSPNASVCRSFATYGYCQKGAECQERHVRECPDFNSTGTCATKGCKLPHRHKASVMRNNSARGETVPDAENSDISSDEDEDEIDSDDVDSDDLTEYFGDDGEPDAEMPKQDFVQLA